MIPLYTEDQLRKAFMDGWECAKSERIYSREEELEDSLKDSDYIPYITLKKEPQ